MQFRAEAFNVTNTPAFNNPNADASRLGKGDTSPYSKCRNSRISGIWLP